MKPLPAPGLDVKERSALPAGAMVPLVGSVGLPPLPGVSVAASSVPSGFSRAMPMMETLL